MKNIQTFCFDLNRATTDVLERLYDARKWCEENGYEPLPIKLSEISFKALHHHPQLRGRLGISKYWPIDIQIYGFTFVVDVFAEESDIFTVPLKADVEVKDSLVFDFELNR